MILSESCSWRHRNGTCALSSASRSQSRVRPPWSTARVELQSNTGTTLELNSLEQVPFFDSECKSRTIRTPEPRKQKKKVRVMCATPPGPAMPSRRKDTKHEGTREEASTRNGKRWTQRCQPPTQNKRSPHNRKELRRKWAAHSMKWATKLRMQSDTWPLAG